MRKFFLPLGIFVAFSILGQPSFGGSGGRSGGGTTSAGKVPTFTVDQAILTALQRNPALLNAEQEIKRTKGVIIQVRAQALPQVNVNGRYDWTDPNLRSAQFQNTATTITGTTTGTAASIVDSPTSQAGAVQAGASPTPIPTATNTQLSDIS